MSGREARRSRQAKATADRHYYKFISYYVRATHKEIYDEAEALFRQAKADNPGVKDLVKTATYLRRVHPHATIPRYYTSRNLKPKQGCTKKMVLNIPLIPIQATGSLASVESPPPEIAESTPLSTPSELTESTPPELAESTPLSTLPEHTETTQVSTSPQLLLPTEIYEGLLMELRSDPELESILNDFSIDSVNDFPIDSVNDFPIDSVNDFPIDSVNDFPIDSVLNNDMVCQDEITPLELELQTMLDKTQ